MYTIKVVPENRKTLHLVELVSGGNFAYNEALANAS